MKWLRDLLRDEERAGNVVVGCVVGVMWVSFILAVLAILLDR